MTVADAEKDNEWWFTIACSESFCLRRIESSERQFSAHVKLKHDKWYTLSQATQMKSH